MKYERDKVKAWAGDNQWKALQADLARFHVHGFSGWATEGFWALAIFRFQKIASMHVFVKKAATGPVYFVLNTNSIRLRSRYA